MTSKSLKVCGWLAMASAFLTLPLVYLSYTLEGKADLNSIIIQTSIEVLGSLLFIAILVCLKMLLNKLFKFTETDRNIYLLIIIGIITSIISIISTYQPTMKEPLGNVIVVIIILQGIVHIQFGYKLLKVHFTVDGLLKPYCYLNMLTGVLIGSILLIPIGIAVSAVSDLMLGTMFFNISNIIKSTEINNTVKKES